MESDMKQDSGCLALGAEQGGTVSGFKETRGVLNWVVATAARFYTFTKSLHRARGEYIPYKL